jgi:hypothetical protein
MKEVVTTVFEALHQRTRVMAVNPGTSNYFRKAAEAKGIKYFEMPAEDRAKLREVATRVQENFIKKATPRTLEAWKLVKPIVLGK